MGSNTLAHREKHRGTGKLWGRVSLSAFSHTVNDLMFDQEEIELRVKGKVDRVVLDCIRKRD